MKKDCFLDKDRPCTSECRAFEENTCQLLSNLKSMKTDARKSTRALESLAKFLHHRPPPRP